MDKEIEALIILLERGVYDNNYTTPDTTLYQAVDALTIQAGEIERLKYIVTKMLASESKLRAEYAKFIQENIRRKDDERR